MDYKTVYAVFTCDEYKSRSSMRLIAVADDDGIDRIYEDIKKDYDYTDEDIETYIYTEEIKLNELC